MAPSSRQHRKHESRAAATRAQHLLQNNDVAAVRLTFKRLAERGIAEAASGLAQTYDPHFLKTIPTGGLQPDMAVACHWYEWASALGSDAAGSRLSDQGPLASRGRRPSRPVENATLALSLREMKFPASSGPAGAQGIQRTDGLLFRLGRHRLFDGVARRGIDRREAQPRLFPGAQAAFDMKHFRNTGSDASLGCRS